MAMFEPFKKATQAKSPKIYEAEMDAYKAKAHAQALRNKTAMDAASLYNIGMGDKSPIYDYAFGGGEATAGVPEMIAARTPSTMATVVPSGGETLLAETMAGAQPTMMVAPEAASMAAGGEALTAEALGSGVLESAATTGASGIGSTLAAATPYGAALAAALYADDQLLDGKVLDAHEDVLGGMFGKGWLWS